MSNVSISRRAWLLFLPACGLLGFSSSCHDDRSIGFGPPRRSLDFVYFVHPGNVEAGAPSALRAGVIVGPDLCWYVAGAGINRQGDRLWISGIAHHRSFGACPLAIAYDTITVAIPALEPGDYLLAAGDLVDTLRVGRPGPLPPGAPFAARGDICQADRGCILFRCEHPNAHEIEGVVTRGLPSGPAPGGTCRLVVAATVAGRDTCSGHERNTIELRGYAFRVP